MENTIKQERKKKKLKNNNNSLPPKIIFPKMHEVWMENGKQGSLLHHHGLNVNFLSNLNEVFHQSFHLILCVLFLDFFSFICHQLGFILCRQLAHSPLKDCFICPKISNSKYSAHSSPESAIFLCLFLSLCWSAVSQSAIVKVLAGMNFRRL